MITEQQVIDVQNKWALGIVKIGSLKDNRTKCKTLASNFLDDFYLFDHGFVLFKPTKCLIEQFRPTKSKALSYFIAGEDRECKEDKGFATTPWKKVRFENFNIILEENRAIAMGNYFFTDFDNNEFKIQYTFGYRLVNGKVKIDLHHSSYPYNS